MDFLLELILTVVLGIVLEGLAFLLTNKLQNKKHKTALAEPDVDHENFTMRYSKDIKGLMWVLCGFMGISTLAAIIALIFTYNDERMSLTDFIIAESTFLIILLIMVFFVFKIFFFRIEVRNNIFTKFTLFRVKKIDVKSADRIRVKGEYRELIIFKDEKKILKITTALTNFDVAAEIIREMGVLLESV